jgi:hypothetical protein
MVFDSWHTPDYDGPSNTALHVLYAAGHVKVVTLRAGERLDGCLEETHVHHACRASNLQQ